MPFVQRQNCSTAEAYRQYAEELRTVAGSMRPGANRDTLLGVATNFDAMAQSADGIARCETGLLSPNEL